MSAKENRTYALMAFDNNAANQTIIQRFTDDVDATVEKARGKFEAIIPSLPYLDEDYRSHPMAAFTLFCGISFSYYIAMKESLGVSEDEFGRVLLEEMEARSKALKSVPGPTALDRIEALRESGEISRQSPREGDFVFEAIDGEGKDFDWGVNVTSCPICTLATDLKLNELMPFLCATDDIISSVENTGLEHKGSIGLGAKVCEFVYREDGGQKRSADEYPDRIQVRNKD